MAMYGLQVGERYALVDSTQNNPANRVTPLGVVTFLGLGEPLNVDGVDIETARVRHADGREATYPAFELKIIDNQMRAKLGNKYGGSRRRNRNRSCRRRRNRSCRRNRK
jgi:hypothetical protein